MKSAQAVNSLDEQAFALGELITRLGRSPIDLGPADMLDPNKLRARLSEAVPRSRVMVTGESERRLVMIETETAGVWQIADMAGVPLGENEWPTWFGDEVEFRDPTNWVSDGVVPESVVARMQRPRVLLAALYHPEYFPLPRFPLGISDCARAARAQLCERVDLLDMQLGATLDDITAAAAGGAYDLVGISATFGQHDLEIAALDQIFALDTPPLVVAGGSLTVRNERALLERYPDLLIARGAGEDTVQDLVLHLRGDLSLEQVSGIGFAGASFGEGTMAISIRKTGKVPNRRRTDFLPELDLLEKTFAHQGVAQLESSRGCTNFCSFCPRGHKGTWSGDITESFDWMVDAIGRVFDLHPEIRRTIYLVDEEFIGKGLGTAERALNVASSLHQAGLTWETSCRVDQVVHQSEDIDWHRDRVHMWRKLREQGLKRCLFGIESGVTSILERFNKETTGEQNALAIRTLSALGVPTRFTYITFDHLMTYDELRATAAFQERSDLILRPLEHLSADEIVQGVRDEAFVAEHSAGVPFYRSISYMLVSMECLIGAAYTRRAQAEGLTGDTRPSMGRVDARFADWRIGTMSHHAQLWVDRNFALDYTMKSIEKVTSGAAYDAVRELRRVLKSSAFELLKEMIYAGERYGDTPDAQLTADLLSHMNRIRDKELIPALRDGLEEVVKPLSDKHARTLLDQHERWLSSEGWALINAQDNCD